jgi:serine/threonine protein kinase
MALPVGYVLDNYRIEHMLGNKGGFGITYLAFDQSLLKNVAIKELLPDGIAVRMNGRVVPQSHETADLWEWALDAFKREARMLANFKHPNIVQVHRLLEANGTAYIVMEFLDGQSLESYLKQLGPFPPEAELRRIFGQIMDGLQAVHQQHLVHRDIKPENIYVTEEGRIILLDFGAARPDNTEKTTAITQLIVPGYSPFEQYQSTGKLGPPSDIYSAAATMVRALTGHRPPIATDRIMEDEWVPLTTQYPGRYSASLLAAIDKGLGLRAKDRPQNVAAWRELLNGTAPPLPPPPPESVWGTAGNEMRPPALPPERKRLSTRGMVAAIAGLIGVSASLAAWALISKSNEVVHQGNGANNTNGTPINAVAAVTPPPEIKTPQPPPKPAPSITPAPAPAPTPTPKPKPAAPVVAQFSADDTTVASASSVKLRWDVSNADTITISPDVGVVTGSTQVIKAPNSTTIYTITARNEGGWDSKELILRVGAAPVVSYFTAPSRIVLGGAQGEIKWSVKNTSRVKLNQQSYESEKTVYTLADKAGPIKYTLYAENDFGSVAQTLQIEVTEDPWDGIKRKYEDKVAAVLENDLQVAEGASVNNYAETVVVDGTSKWARDHCATEAVDNAKFVKDHSGFISYWVELIKGSYDSTQDTVRAKQYFFFRRLSKAGVESHDWCTRVAHLKNVSTQPKIFKFETLDRNRAGQKMSFSSSAFSTYAKESIFQAVRNRGSQFSGYADADMIFLPKDKIQTTTASGGMLYVYRVSELPQGKRGNFVVIVRPYKE